MQATRLGIAWVCGLLLALGGRAWAADDEGPGAGPRRPRRLRPGGLQRPGQGEAGARPPRGPLGMEIAELQAEMKRHHEAMRAITGGRRELVEPLREQLRELLQGDAEPAEIEALIKEKCAAKLKEQAAKLAEELATHHANLAKLFQSEGIADKVADGMAKQAARAILQMARRRRDGQGGPGPRPRPDGPRPPRGERPPRPEKHDAPENF